MIDKILKEITYMIRKMNQEELNKVMNIWLETNIKAHNFIPAEYWENNFELVKGLISQAEIYIYENNKSISGFIGMNSNYVAGIFVKEKEQCMRGSSFIFSIP